MQDHPTKKSSVLNRFYLQKIPVLILFIFIIVIISGSLFYSLGRIVETKTINRHIAESKNKLGTPITPEEIIIHP